MTKETLAYFTANPQLLVALVKAAQEYIDSKKEEPK